MRCTSAYKQYCHVGHIAQQNQLGLFQDSGISVYLEDVKSISCETLCVFGSDTVVPVSWMCKKQTCVSHSSTQAEDISFHAGLRMYGIPALDFWDLVIEVLHSGSNRKQKLKPEQGNQFL